VAEEGGQMWGMEIGSGQEFFEAVAQEQQEQRAAVRQAAYDYRDAAGAYGGRSLRTPDGRADRAHYVYTRSTPHHHSRPHYSRRQSHNYGWRSGGGRSDTGQRWSHAQGGPETEGFFAGLLRVIFDLWNR
jgi:hypothetical protein